MAFRLFDELTRRLLDEDGGQGAEDEGLDAAAEPVKVEAGDGGDADGQPGELDAYQADKGQSTKNGQDDAENLQALLLFCPSEEEQRKSDGSGAHSGKKMLEPRSFIRP